MLTIQLKSHFLAGIIFKIGNSTVVAIVSIWLSVVACHIPKFGDRCIHQL